jgi:hypothetical protein
VDELTKQINAFSFPRAFIHTYCLLGFCYLHLPRVTVTLRCNVMIFTLYIIQFQIYQTVRWRNIFKYNALYGAAASTVLMYGVKTGSTASFSTLPRGTVSPKYRGWSSKRARHHLTQRRQLYHTERWHSHRLHCFPFSPLCDNTFTQLYGVLQSTVAGGQRLHNVSDITKLHGGIYINTNGDELYQMARRR